MFDLSEYNVRQLDPQQGTKPLDFGGGGITGSVNLDGRLIAINTYHPEHGYITLTSIPPFPEADRYDQKKVRAYRKSLVTNEGFGLQFEQEIIKREYYLIEDAVPFIRFTLDDGTIAECVTIYNDVGGSDGHRLRQEWRFSRDKVIASYVGNIWLMRTAYSQLTEGGVVPMPSMKLETLAPVDGALVIRNPALHVSAHISGVSSGTYNDKKNILWEEKIRDQFIVSLNWRFQHDGYRFIETDTQNLRTIEDILSICIRLPKRPLLINRAVTYGLMCCNPSGSILTDHMILPLVWTRDSYYVMKNLERVGEKIKAENSNPTSYFPFVVRNNYVHWLFEQAWEGTFSKAVNRPIKNAWGRSYMANGRPKDNSAFQLDQQLFPFLALVEYLKLRPSEQESMFPRVKRLFTTLHSVLQSNHNHLYVTDETPADDDIPLQFHFSSHILLWYVYKQLDTIYNKFEEKNIAKSLLASIQKNFITEHNGNQIYSYATDGEGNHYLYHDANDIPLVMMPLWGFCDKDDLIWRNTIDFAFSSDNPGFYDGVLGSVHTPAPWSLGDAQELILSKVIGDRERYQRVWERVEKAAQWDGALPEAYDATTFEVVSRHWFAWTNAMVAIADSLSWDWETEGEYAR